ncbi:hypothetical protein P7H12_26075 [Paenibacillus larvae]|nr:hypothetical protein [Paenibacillus larvae]MDT2266381.1 hypothetical protein [Paenibacillus larvae]
MSNPIQVTGVLDVFLLPGGERRQPNGDAKVLDLIGDENDVDLRLRRVGMGCDRCR